MEEIKLDLYKLKQAKLNQLTIEKRVYSVKYLIARNDLLTVTGTELDNQAKKELEALLVFYQLKNTKYEATWVHLAVQEALQKAKLKLLKPKIQNKSFSDMWWVISIGVTVFLIIGCIASFYWKQIQKLKKKVFLKT